MAQELVVLVADKDIEYGLRGLLARPRALGMRSISSEILVHPKHDPGCVGDAHNVLRTYARDYAHALVVFDREGSGREAVDPRALEREMQSRLATSGWGDRAEVIAIDPELEVWVFAASPHVEGCFGWPKRLGTLRRWLARQGFWPEGQAKPGRPKEAVERILREIRRPRSPALYHCLGQRVGVKRCSDGAFLKLIQVLGSWFPLVGA